MKTAIIGAGATGLAAAYILARAGSDVTVVEASPRAGGLMSTFDVGGDHPLETFYHHFFTHDAEIAWLLGELGLEDRVAYRDSTMGMFRGGELYPFDGPLDLLRFRAIGLVARLRFGASSAVLAYEKSFSDAEDVRCLDWFERWAGAEATRAIWRPMLRIKFGDAAPDIPLAWIAGRLRQRVRSREGGVERLGYLDGSLQVLVDRLLEKLAALGVDVRLGAPTTALLCDDGVVRGVATDGDRIDADRVVSTVPTPVLATLVEPIDAAYAGELSRVGYMGAICTILDLSESLSDVYWTNVADDGYDFGGVIEHTNLVPPERYGGSNLVYLSRYMRHDNPLWSMTDEELLDRQLDQLGRLYGRDVRSMVGRSWIFRGRYAAPLTELGFHRKIPACRSPLKNLFVSSIAHVYPDERSVNNSIRIAAEAVRAMGLAGAADAVPRGASLAAKYGF